MTTKTSTAAATDPTGRFLGKVHVVTEGEAQGPAVAMIHGIPGSTRDFRYLAPAIAALGMRAVRIDLPGFGRTPADAFPSTRVADRAVFIHKVMGALGHTSFALAGHSFGGGIATHCASLFPDDVRALVAVNSIGPRRHHGYRAPGAVIRASTHLLDLPLIGKRWHEAVLRGYQKMGLRSDTPLDIDAIKLQFNIFGAVSFKDLRAAASRVQCPTLVASAKDDLLIQPSCAFALVRALHRAPLVSHLHVDHGGHFLQKHQATAIAAWLSRTLGTASARAAA